MKNIKLYHLHFNSRAVIIRAMLTYKKIPFEDIRITGENWKTLKYSGKFEFQNLPKLEVDGREYVQMYSINNYLARQLDLFGNNIEEDYQINSLLNSYEDFAGQSRKQHLLPTEEQRKEAGVRFNKVGVPFFLSTYEKRFKKYGGKYAVGDKFTLADIYLTCYLWNNYKAEMKMKKLGSEVLETHCPLIAEHIKKIKENELKEFFEKVYIHNEDPNEMAVVAEIIRNS